MKPVAESAGAVITASEPSKLGTDREDEGGATAPMQNAEHALHDECDNFASSASVE